MTKITVPKIIILSMVVIALVITGRYFVSDDLPQATLPKPPVDKTLIIAVASNFVTPMQALIAQYPNQDVDIQMVSGSSGQLTAQIGQGAPYDVFFSADNDRPAKLVEAGLAVAESQQTYAIGTLVLLSDQPQRYNLTNPVAVLAQQQDIKIALANPALAPYGLAAKSVLDKLGLIDSSRPQWVMGENIAQAYQYVHTGNAPVGFVSLAQVITAYPNQPLSQLEQTGKIWIIPSTYYPPIRQDSVIMSASTHQSSAKEFLEYIQSQPAQALIRQYGYQ